MGEVEFAHWMTTVKVQKINGLRKEKVSLKQLLADEIKAKKLKDELLKRSIHGPEKSRSKVL